jgi:hypothetical protein
VNVVTGTEVIAQGGGTRPPEGLLLNVYEDLTGGLVTAVVEAVNDGNDEVAMSQQIASGDRAALMARLVELVNVLSGPELVELGSLLHARGCAHGLAWGREAPW